VSQLKADIEGPEGTASEQSLRRAWTAWMLSKALGEMYGARSFGLIALGVGFEQMRALDDKVGTASYGWRR